ncbi:MAG: HAD hydrolase family protein [Micrococcaceae bacterium]
MAKPPFGLLLDIDGPIASPVTRKISIPSIITDLLYLAKAEIPVIFNTGRGDVFVNEQVVQPLQAAHLPDHITMYTICEKGGTWATITSQGLKNLHIDHDKELPAEYFKGAKKLIDEKYSDWMFFDDTKHTMVSVEQHEDIDNEQYRKVQKKYDADAVALFQKLDIPAVLEGKNTSDKDPEFIIEPTIISTDIQSINVGKDVGAARAVQLAKDTHHLPDTWYSVGDSRSDYAMADWLHEKGYESIFVDVRPADGVPEKPYKIMTYGDKIHDEACAEFLAERVQEVKATQK